MPQNQLGAANPLLQLLRAAAAMRRGAQQQRPTPTTPDWNSLPKSPDWPPKPRTPQAPRGQERTVSDYQRNHTPFDDFDYRIDVLDTIHRLWPTAASQQAATTPSRTLQNVEKAIRANSSLKPAASVGYGYDQSGRPMPSEQMRQNPLLTLISNVLSLAPSVQLAEMGDEALQGVTPDMSNVQRYFQSRRNRD